MQSMLAFRIFIGLFFRFGCPAIFLLGCFLPVAAQNRADIQNIVNRDYWTRSVLATRGSCEIRITSTDLAPVRSDCTFTDHLGIGTKVRVTQIVKNKNWTKVEIEHWEGATSIYLSNRSRSEFRRAFNQFFSRVEIDLDMAACEVVTKRDVIRQLGFPSRISRSGHNEIWTLDFTWIGGYPCGFDETYIEISKNRVIQITGSV